MRKGKIQFVAAIAFLLFAVPKLLYGNPPDDGFNLSQIYPIDRGHSYIEFSVKYMGFAKVRGRFADFSGAFRYDPNDITKTSATVIIKVESIDTDHEFRNRDLKSANWFEAEKYPLMKFQSKRVVKGQAGVEVVGDLTIRDVTKEVALKMEYHSGVQKDIRGDTQVIFTGSATIDRKEFGVKGERWSAVKEGMTAVASEVEIELSILGKQINAPNFRNWVSNLESPQGKIYKTVTESGVAGGIKEFQQLKSASGDKISADVLNVVGYMLLKEGKTDEALQIFEHNAGEFAGNPNVYDSLGEAYGVKGDKQNAIKNYKLALEKDPLNANAMEILRHLGK
jgi:polyisoprenoid-binding protein YceI